MSSQHQQPMRSVWHSLLWKEWHEHKWKLAAMTALIFVVPAIFFSESQINFSVSLGLLGGSIIPYGILAGLFIGMGTAANENHRSTMRFLQTLPVGMQKPAIAKLLLSLVTVAVPIIALAFVAAYYLPWAMENSEYLYLHELSIDRGIPIETIRDEMLAASLEHASRHSPLGGWSLNSIYELCVVTAFGGVLFVGSLLLWMAACGVNRSDEIRAGAIGFLALMLFWGITAGG